MVYVAMVYVTKMSMGKQSWEIVDILLINRPKDWRQNLPKQVEYSTKWAASLKHSDGTQEGRVEEMNKICGCWFLIA